MTGLLAPKSLVPDYVLKYSHITWLEVPGFRTEAAECCAMRARNALSPWDSGVSLIIFSQKPMPFPPPGSSSIFEASLGFPSPFCRAASRRQHRSACPSQDKAIDVRHSAESEAESQASVAWKYVKFCVFNKVREVDRHHPEVIRVVLGRDGDTRVGLRRGRSIFQRPTVAGKLVRLIKRSPRTVRARLKK